MARDWIEENWREFDGPMKEYWGKLTEEDLLSIAGKRELLLGKLQAAYGYAREAAELEIEVFLKMIRSHDAVAVPAGVESHGEEKPGTLGASPTSQAPPKLERDARPPSPAL